MHEPFSEATQSRLGSRAPDQRSGPEQKHLGCILNGEATDVEKLAQAGITRQPPLEVASHTAQLKKWAPERQKVHDRVNEVDGEKFAVNV
jgi:hypothetical protein